MPRPARRVGKSAESLYMGEPDAKVFHCESQKRFDRARCFPYTLRFVRDVSSLVRASAKAGEGWKGISSVPEHSTREWDRRAAGMGRQPRKAE